MLRLSGIGTWLAAVFLATAANAQQFTSIAEVEAALANTRVTLADVFKRELRQAIVAAAGPTSGLDDVVLRFTESCDLIPVFEPNSVPPEVQMNGREFIALGFYISQATLLYALGSPELDQPEALTDYIETTIRPFMSDLYDDCIRITPDGTDLLAVMRLSYFDADRYSGGRYEDVLNAARARPNAERTGDYIGGLPLFFIALHEIAHHLQLLSGERFDRPGADEFAADQFAADIIAAGDLSPTLALPVMHAFAVGRHADELQCRLATLARNDDRVMQRTLEMLVQYRVRIEALRLHYIDLFEDACRP